MIAFARRLPRVECSFLPPPPLALALLYEYMQGEIPGNTQVLPWPGAGMPGECDNASTGQPKRHAAAGQGAAGQSTGSMSEADLSKVFARR